jgi:hypothetical protein
MTYLYGTALRLCRSCAEPVQYFRMMGAFVGSPPGYQDLVWLLAYIFEPEPEPEPER